MTFIVLGSLSAILVSMTKAGFGGSLGILSFPLMVYACGGKAFLAGGIMLVLLIACDLVAVVSWWRKWVYRAMMLLLPGSMIGIVLGWIVMLALRRVENTHGGEFVRKQADSSLMLAVGLVAAAFVVLKVVGHLRARAIAFRPTAWQGSAVGAAAGLTSTVAHAAGPVVTMYLLAQQMPKGQFVATTVLFYAIVNQVKLIPYLSMGLINTQTLGAALLLLPAVLAGTVLGLALHNRIKQRQFTGVIYTLLALAGGHMIYKGLIGLFFNGG